ncbi:hypothetical protein D3C74_456060 [compost metagenome]
MSAFIIVGNDDIRHVLQITVQHHLPFNFFGVEVFTFYAFGKNDFPNVFPACFGSTIIHVHCVRNGIVCIDTMNGLCIIFNLIGLGNVVLKM